MRTLTYAEALNEAIKEEMERDERVFCLGEDIGPHGGAYRVTKGLFDIFGKERIRNTPISELGFTGLAVGAAMKGLRPIVEYMYIDFSLLATDQIINQAAKLRYMTGGKVQIPIVFRTQGGAGKSTAGQHSQSLEALYYHIPGLKVVMPSSPSDAKGLLKAAIRDNNPVVFIEHKNLYHTKGEVPEKDYIIDIGKADIKRQGIDLTIITYSAMVLKALSVAEKLKEKIDIEVIDLRTLFPLDMELIVSSVKKTNKVIIIQEAVRRGGVASDISSQIIEKVFDYLDYPVKIIAGQNTIIPYSSVLESLAIPNEELIEKEIMEFL
ncbi:MAG: alpha-ketoacid dehydrogenase subunit beta [Candidatus Humimicrobiaceae bacterium]